MRGKWILSAAALAAAIGLSGHATAQTAGDPPGDRSSRARLTPGQPVTGAVERGGDTDWYRVAMRTGQLYRIALDGAGDNALSDPLLRIVDADGNELAVNDDARDGLNSYLEYTPSRNGDVFVEARGFGDEAAGGYRLSLEAARLPPDPASAATNTRARLNFGQPVQAGIDYAGDKDWYRVALQAGQSYRFTLNGGEGEGVLSDPFLRLHGPDGVEIASDDDGGDGFNSYLEFTATTAGNYYIEASGFGEGLTGSYTIAANEGDIPNGETTDASLSVEGDAREGRLSPAGDSDWYKITLTAGQSIRAMLNGGEGEGMLNDPLLVLHAPGGAEVAQDDDSGEGLNSWLEYTAASAGTYYLEAKGFGEEAQGRYTISLIAGEIPGTAEGAETLATGEGRISTINANGDADWFGIELIEGRPYRFTLEGVEPDQLADPVLTIFDSEGHQVATDDDGGQGANAYITFVSPKGGAFFAAVTSFNNTGTGRYHLRVSDTDVPGNSNTDEMLSGDEDERMSSVDFAEDVDWYGVQLEAGVRYEITVSGEGDRPLADPFLAVMNGEGTQVTSDDDSGSGLDARLVFTPQVSSNFYLQASGLAGSTGGYKIAIKRLTTTAPARR